MGSNKKFFWEGVYQRIKSKIASWKVRWLSLSSRILLIKLILSAIPNYYMAVMQALCSIVSQIQKLLPSIFSPEQGGLVPSRETMEGAMVAHEVLHSIKSNQSSNFVVKLDMQKAYDRVCWNFLFQVL